MKQDQKIIAIIGSLTLLVLIGGVWFASRAPQTQDETPVMASQTERLVRDYSPTMATESAQITLVEFADFQCPACAGMNPTVKQLMEDFESDLRLVFRHYPLPQHQNAQGAAMAAEAAGVQGQFFAMGDLLYENQDDWANSNNPQEMFIEYAQELELDVEQFQNDLESSELQSHIDQDTTDGQVLGVNATPTFFLEGEKISGGLNYDEFRSRIESLLEPAGEDSQATDSAEEDLETTE